MESNGLAGELRFSYLQDACESPDALLLLHFDDYCQGVQNTTVSTGLALLDGSCLEAVTGEFSSAELQRDGDLVWGELGSSLIVVCALEELNSPLDALAECAYIKVIEHIERLGYPNLVRVWNYFERINAFEEGLERYQRFCLGRHKAFAAKGISHLAYPSACALGHQGGKLLVYCLATRAEVRHFENPVQQEAYFYPERYGPKSPSFARASLYGNSLFVSGTASVVGHETLFPDDISAQLVTTKSNLEALIAHVAAQTDSAVEAWIPTILKVYVRHAEHLDVVREHISRFFPNVATTYVHADICRNDLLVEVDGIWEREDK